VALGLCALKASPWVGEIGEGLNTITVEVREQAAVMHQVSFARRHARTRRTPQTWQNLGMSAQPNPPENPRVKLNQNRVDFLKTDLSVCSTFLDLAATRLKMGNRKSAKTAIANAEKGYKTLSRYLTDRKHSSHLTADQIREIKSEMKRLRERLNGFQSQP